MSRTVSDLIQEVRENLEEYNENSITDSKILSAMNRGQKQAMSILADKAEEALLAYHDFTTVNGDNTYALPSDILAQKIDSVEIIDANGKVLYAINRGNIKNTRIERSLNSYHYSNKYIIQGNNIILAPSPSSAFIVRVWYVKSLERMTLDQGRIVSIAATSITVNSIGTDLTNLIDDLKCFISIVDGETGDAKGVYQISSIVGNLINIKTSSLGRSTVYKKTVLSALSSSIALDDYVCLAIGSCISQLPELFQDYIVQYATSQIITSIGEDNTAYDRELKILEKRLESAWAGKEGHLKVKVNKDRSRYPYFVSNL